MNLRFGGLATFVMPVGLLLSACGGGGSSSTTTPQPSVTRSTLTGSAA
ncbi:MAG: hypothetical protein ACRETC_10105 [Gammaproteobacteria bacterium]